MFVLVLIASMSMQAQSLVGKWKTQLTENGQKMDCVFTYKENKTFNMKMKVAANDPEVGTIHMSMSTNGKYVHKADSSKLELTMNAKSARLDIDRIEFASRLRTTIGMVPGMEETVRKELNKTLDGRKDELLESIPANGMMIIEKLTDTELVLKDKDDGQKVVFKRAK